MLRLYDATAFCLSKESGTTHWAVRPVLTVKLNMSFLNASAIVSKLRVGGFDDETRCILSLWNVHDFFLAT